MYILYFSIIHWTPGEQLNWVAICCMHLTVIVFVCKHFFCIFRWLLISSEISAVSHPSSTQWQTVPRPSRSEATFRPIKTYFPSCPSAWRRLVWTSAVPWYGGWSVILTEIFVVACGSIRSLFCLNEGSAGRVDPVRQPGRGKKEGKEMVKNTGERWGESEPRGDAETELVFHLWG